MSSQGTAAIHPQSPSSFAVKPGAWQRLAGWLLIVGAFFSSVYRYGELVPGLIAVCDAFFIMALLASLMGGFGGRWALRSLAVWLLLVAAAIFALSGLITFASGGVDSASLQSAKIVFCIVVVPLIIGLVGGTSGRATMEKFLAAWLAGGWLSALSASASSFGIVLPGLHDEVAASGWRVQGLAYHPNLLAYSVVLVVPVLVYFCMRAKYSSTRLLIGVLGLPLLYATYASGSRAALLALAIGLLPLLLTRRIWIAFAIASIGVAVIVMLVFILLQQADMQSGASMAESAIGRFLGLAESAEISDEGRLYFIAQSFSKFESSPMFGVGYGGVREAHVHVLAILQAGGIVGLLALLCWLGAIFVADRQVASAQPVYPDDEQSGELLLQLVRCGVLIWLVCGALQPLLTDRNGYMAMGLLFAMLIAVQRKQHDEIQISQT